MVRGGDGQLTAVRRRLTGIDLARAIAIVGMLAVHVGPTGAPGAAGELYALPHGRASLLFALVAGIGVSLLASSRTTSLASTRLALVWRTVVLLPLGLWLQGLDHGVRVVLAQYAALFLLAAVVVTWRDRWLATLAVTSALVGSTVFVWGTVAAPEVFTREVVGLDTGVGVLLHRLVLSGAYPLVTWTAPLLVGMLLGRRELSGARMHRRLVVGGAAAAVGSALVGNLVAAALDLDPASGGWARLLSTVPHSQSPVWVLGSTGSAVLVVGLSLAFAERLPRLSAPLVALGQLAFTFYVGHLLVLHVARDVLASDTVGRASLVVLGGTAVGCVVALGWRSLAARGPLETVLHLPRRVGSRRRG